MRILFELALFAIVSGAVFLFYRAIMKKIDGEKKGGEKGFTFIELLITISIICILAAIAVPQFQKDKNIKQKSTRNHMTHSRSNVVDFKCPNCSYELSVNSKEELK